MLLLIVDVYVVTTRFPPQKQFVKIQLQYTVTSTQDFGNKIRESHPTDLGQLLNLCQQM